MDGGCGTWLIIGGDGVIGQKLRADARPHAERVVSSSRRAPVLGSVLVDLSSVDFSDALAVKPHVAFLCAATTNMQSCESDPLGSARVNVHGTVQLAEALCDLGCFVVFLSSNAVFDGSQCEPAEDAPYSPTTEYGRQKMQAEIRLRRLETSRGGCAIVRLSKILTPDVGMGREFLKSLRCGTECEAFDDLMISPISLGHAASVLVKIASRRMSGVFHLSGEEELSYADLGSRLAARMGMDSGLIRPVSVADSSKKVLFGPQHPALGMTRTMQVLGIGPQPVEEVLLELLNG